MYMALFGDSDYLVSEPSRVYSSICPLFTPLDGGSSTHLTPAERESRAAASQIFNIPPVSLVMYTTQPGGGKVIYETSK